MKKLTTVLLIVSLLFSCGKKKQEQKSDIKNTSVKVTIQKIGLSTEDMILTYSGTIKASKTIPLTFKSVGNAEEIFVGEGDFVEEGQLIARLEKGSLMSSYQGALASYDQALDAKQRLERVYNKGSLPEIQWVEINTKLAQAKSLLDISNRNLENCELRAPADGYIGRRNMEVGQSGIQLQAPFELVELSTVKAKISVPENEINLFKKGQIAAISVAALNGKEFQGVVEKIGVVAHSLSRTYEVTIVIDNSELRLKPGMVCEVIIAIPSVEAVLVVPLEAIKRTARNEAYVFVVNPSTKVANKRIIKTDGIFHNKIVVTSGLHAGDLIVVRGFQKINDNMQVEY